MPEQCLLGNFNSVLEIAFALSAVLYFLDLAQNVESRIKFIQDEYSSLIGPLALTIDMRPIYSSLPSNLTHAQIETYASEKIKEIRKLAGSLRKLLAVVHASNVIFVIWPFPILSLFSAAASLLALFYSGFSQGPLPCAQVIAILVCAYAFIIYYCIYYIAFLVIMKIWIEPRSNKLGKCLYRSQPGQPYSEPLDG